MRRYRIKREWVRSPDPSRKFGGPLNAGDMQWSIQVRTWLFFWRTMVSSKNKKAIDNLFSELQKNPVH